MLNRKKSIVGLDIGTNEIKAVELTRFGDSTKITAFGWARMPPRVPVPPSTGRPS